MDTQEISDRFVAPCFVNGLEAYDVEINLGMEENMISNEFAVKLCLDHEVKHGNKEKEAKREALAINIYRRYSLLEEERLVIKTMVYSDKYKKVLDGICLDKMKLDGEMKKEEEKAIIKGEALIEKEDPRAFAILIRLEGKINLNALADTGFDINVMPYCVYKELGREEFKNVNRGITMLNHSKAEHIGILKDVLCQ
nr:hypothetical protein [Tanacetum cinerariifolium]